MSNNNLVGSESCVFLSWNVGAQISTKRIFVFVVNRLLYKKCTNVTWKPKVCLYSAILYFSLVNNHMHVEAVHTVVHLVLFVICHRRVHSENVSSVVMLCDVSPFGWKLQLACIPGAQIQAHCNVATSCLLIFPITPQLGHRLIGRCWRLFNSQNIFCKFRENDFCSDEKI